MITDHHTKYYAYELIKAGGSGIERFGRALFDACVDLNPHQIEAVSLYEDYFMKLNFIIFKI